MTPTAPAAVIAVGIPVASAVAWVVTVAAVAGVVLALTSIIVLAAGIGWGAFLRP